MELFNQAKNLRRDLCEPTARACCRALAPSTLANYLDCVRTFEDFAGEPFWTLLPIEEHLLLDYLFGLSDRGCKASTLNQHVSAIGTFGEWLGYDRPRTSTIDYVLKGHNKF